MKLLILTFLGLMICGTVYSESFTFHQNTKEEAVAVNINVSTEPRGAWINCRNDGSCRFSLCLEMEKKWRSLVKGYRHRQGHSPEMITEIQWYAACKKWSVEFPIATEKNIRLIDLEIKSLKESIRKESVSDNDDTTSNISDAQDIVSNSSKILESLLSKIGQLASSNEKGDE